MKCIVLDKSLNKLEELETEEPVENSYLDSDGNFYKIEDDPRVIEDPPETQTYSKLKPTMTTLVEDEDGNPTHIMVSSCAVPVKYFLDSFINYGFCRWQDVITMTGGKRIRATGIQEVDTCNMYGKIVLNDLEKSVKLWWGDKFVGKKYDIIIYDALL